MLGPDLYSAIYFTLRAFSPALGIVVRKPPTHTVLKTKDSISASLEFPNPVAEMPELLFVPDFSFGGDLTKMVAESRPCAISCVFKPLVRLHIAVRARGMANGPPQANFYQRWIVSLDNHSLVLTKLQEKSATFGEPSYPQCLSSLAWSQEKTSQPPQTCSSGERPASFSRSTTSR
jgi:hypothetical protein